MADGSRMAQGADTCNLLPHPSQGPSGKAARHLPGVHRNKEATTSACPAPRRPRLRKDPHRQEVSDGPNVNASPSSPFGLSSSCCPAGWLDTTIWSMSTQRPSLSTGTSLRKTMSLGRKWKLSSRARSQGCQTRMCGAPLPHRPHLWLSCCLGGPGCLGGVSNGRAIGKAGKCPTRGKREDMSK